MPTTDYDAVVVGSGPNGLAAAITLQQQGLSVLLLEAKDTIGGGMRSESLTLPGFIHDVCSAVHPMAADSPFLSALPLDQFGFELVHPPVPAAHPFDDGTAIALFRSIADTAAQSKCDETAYIKLIQPLAEQWPMIAPSILGPLKMGRNPIPLAKFGCPALLPAAMLARSRFSEKDMRGLFAGMAAHAIQPLTNLASSAIALVLMIIGHRRGFPFVKGGSQSLANAMGTYFTSLGGVIETGFTVKHLSQLPSSRAVLLDVTPRQLLTIAGHRFSSIYKWQLERYRYGMGIYKMDWALDEQVPFTATVCRQAGTVHLGGTLEEIMHSEKAAHNGQSVDRPFVLLAQPSLADESRAPAGKHTLWAYCHVAHGSVENMQEKIERQIERFAPGFRDRILARHIMDAQAAELYNPNYIGGDINGGEQNIRQLFTRPALRFSPYQTSARGIYICSSSTPPGGGVHGMCGYHAAQRAWKDIFSQ